MGGESQKYKARLRYQTNHIYDVAGFGELWSDITYELTEVVHCGRATTARSLFGKRHHTDELFRVTVIGQVTRKRAKARRRQTSDL